MVRPPKKSQTGATCFAWVILRDVKPYQYGDKGIGSVRSSRKSNCHAGERRRPKPDPARYVSARTAGIYRPYGTKGIDGRATEGGACMRWTKRALADCDIAGHSALRCPGWRRGRHSRYSGEASARHMRRGLGGDEREGQCASDATHRYIGSIFIRIVVSEPALGYPRACPVSLCSAHHVLARPSVPSLTALALVCQQDEPGPMGDARQHRPAGQ